MHITRVILGFFFLGLISCKTSKENSVVAAKEFCNCLKTNQPLGRDSALNYCHSIVINKYRLYKIYLDTRDTFISSLYSEKTIDSVQNFVAQFAKVVDSCDPPFWLKKSDSLKVR
jgi:hypothetical protein